MTVGGCCCGHDEVAGKRPIGPSMPARLEEMGGSKSSEARSVWLVATDRIERESIERNRAGAIEATPAAREEIIIGDDGVDCSGMKLRRQGRLKVVETVQEEERRLDAESLVRLLMVTRCEREDGLEVRYKGNCVSNHGTNLA